MQNTTRTLLKALFCFSLVTSAACVGGAEVDDHEDHDHVHHTVRQSEILYVMDEQEADERFAPGQADFIPVNEFEPPLILGLNTAVLNGFNRIESGHGIGFDTLGISR